jgi:hypothetical protein
MSLKSDKANVKFVYKSKDSILIESIIDQKNQEYKRNFSSSFHPSNITECTRRLIYKTQIQSDNKNEFLNDMDIVFSKKKWINFFQKTKATQVLRDDFVAADCHYNISGTVDAILKINGNIYVAQVYPICNSDFIKMKENGAFKKDVIEVMTYMWLTETKGGILLYENKDSNECSVFYVDFYIPIINSIKKKCIDLIEYKINGKIPKNPYDSDKSNECLVCEFKEKCFKGKI